VRIFNAIAIHDVYVVAETPEDARAALALYVKEADSKPTELTALEARSENNIRESWREERPLVGASISDADFAKLKGKNVVDAYKMIYGSKAPAKAAAK
jgi:hypothetical protein